MSRKKSAHFWHPGKMFQWLTGGGSRKTRTKKSLVYRNRRSGLVSDALIVPDVALIDSEKIVDGVALSRLPKSRTSRKMKSESYRTFIKEHYKSVSDRVRHEGSTGRKVSTETFRRIAKMWRESGKQMKSEVYAKSRKSGKKTSRKGKRGGGGVVCVCAAVSSRPKPKAKKTSSMKKVKDADDLEMSGTMESKSYNRMESKSYNRKIGPLNKGTLSNFGYHATLSTRKRHEALEQAIAQWGWHVVVKKLVAVATLTKNTSPIKSAKFKDDAHWVSGKYKSRK